MQTTIPATESLYAKAHYNLALTYHERGELGQARAEYERALEIEPNYCEALNNLAVLHRTLGDVQAAIELLKRACASAPKRAQPQINLARLHLGRGDVASAAACLSQADRLAPDRPEPKHWLGLVAIRQHRPAEALKQLRRVLEAEPDHVAARLLLARSLLEQADLDAARSEVRHVLAREPANAYAHNLAGIIAHAAGIDEEAAAQFECAIGLDPNYASPHKNMAILRTSQRDFAAASDAYRRCARLVSDPAERHRIEMLAQRIDHFYTGRPRQTGQEAAPDDREGAEEPAANEVSA
jgi:Flp pilus assembly protein TadD